MSDSDFIDDEDDILAPGRRTGASASRNKAGGGGKRAGRGHGAARGTMQTWEGSLQERRRKEFVQVDEGRLKEDLVRIMEAKKRSRYVDFGSWFFRSFRCFLFSSLSWLVKMVVRRFMRGP